MRSWLSAAMEHSQIIILEWAQGTTFMATHMEPAPFRFMKDDEITALEASLRDLHMRAEAELLRRRGSMHLVVDNG